MKDHITLHVGHTFMMNDPLVVAQALTFLRKGRFDRSLQYAQAEQMLGTGNRQKRSD